MSYAQTMMVNDTVFEQPVTNYRLTPMNVASQKYVRADFQADQTSGEGSLEVSFQDRSRAHFTRIRKYEWDFNNDGVVDDTRANPTHTYLRPGIYSVGLKVSDGAVSHQLVHKQMITVAPRGDNLIFTGIEDCVEVAQSPDLGEGDFTMETWLKGEESNQGPHPIILSNRTQYGIGFLFGFHNAWGNVSHKIPFVELQHNNYIHYQNPPRLLDGRWHHFAVVRKGRNLTYWADGAVVAECAIQGLADLTANAPLRVGNDALLPGDTTFVGTLKHTRIWNQARSARQIQSDLVRDVPAQTEGLVFKLNQKNRAVSSPAYAPLESRSFSAHIPTTAFFH